MKISDKLLLPRLLILVGGGSFFFAFKDWLILPIAAMIWFKFEYKQLKPSQRKNMLKISLMLGLFLMVFDFVIENLGAVFPTYPGYWVSKNSHFLVLHVPIEVMLTCFFGGAAWTLFVYHKRNDWKFIIFNSVLWSVGGTAGERFLNEIKLMAYGNGWLSLPHAFLAYLATFFLLHYILYKIPVKQKP